MNECLHWGIRKFILSLTEIEFRKWKMKRAMLYPKR